MSTAGAQVRRHPFPERELPERLRASFAEVARAPEDAWQGEGHGRRLELSGDVRFFPQSGIFAALLLVIGGVTLVLLGLGAVAAAVVLLVQRGPAELAQGLGFGVTGLVMCAGAVVLFQLARGQTRRRLRHPFGLFLFPEALVIRTPRGCELYPRILVMVELQRSFSGAGSSSNIGGPGGSTYVRLTWTEPDGRQGERVLNGWPVHNAADEALFSILKRWCG